MGRNYYLNERGQFIVKNYNKAFPFFNFLPALAGKWGIPLWAFYVNRAQGIISFGVHDKNHSILEFYPADRALREVPFVGFRTFVKIDHKNFYEPFQNNDAYTIEERMYIESESLKLEEINKDLMLKFTVEYFTLPNMSFASLVRILKIKNLSSKKIHLIIVDGLGRVIPFGARDLFLKNLSRTLEAWMHSQIKNNMVAFRLLVDPKDIAQTKFIEGANFNYAFFKNKILKHPRYIVDPYVVFGSDTSLRKPLKFLEQGFRFPEKQIFCGRAPCGLSFFEWELRSDEERIFYSLWGSVFNKRVLNEVKKITPTVVQEKQRENQRIIEGIKSMATCISSSNVFNFYIKNTYLDNILRGGYPYSYKRNKVYYIFSRKHGDLERDYNKFKIFASYFSEGEGNYRDVNQNRRIDLFFNPFIYKANVVYFMNLIKIDGYNPLIVKGEKLYFDNTRKIKDILSQFKILDDDLLNLMKRGFYLGEIFILMMNKGIKIRDRESFVDFLLTEAKREPKASFGDGYWIDHWHYNLDLIDNFLYFYPDKLKELFLETEFMFWDDECRVRRREERYFLKEEKVYQGNSLEVSDKKRELIEERNRFKNFLRKQRGKSYIYKTNLFVKLLSLILNKTATLDPYGIGIEMEADKPGWCDSLNGLPSLFGSSLCETLELKRACNIIIKAIDSLDENFIISVPVEMYDFFIKMKRLLKNYFCNKNKKKDYIWWQRANEIKESFRDSVFWGIKGKTRGITLKELKEFAGKVSHKLKESIIKAKDKSSGLYYTYFFYEVDKYRKDKNGFIVPLSFKLRKLPLFLESSVHLLRLYPSFSLVKNMKKSALFDNKLHMYRLNMSLDKLPLEIGRSRVFPSGWLENASIWLHMEYKYLLELIKGGFYNNFYDDFFNCLVCFFKPERYGKNILENSSFIVSSAYPDSSLWGKGFVSRLTGATVELLNIWMVICMGERPFFIDNQGELCLQFRPLIKKDLFIKTPLSFKMEGEVINLPRNTFSFKLFSSILVVYHNPNRKDTFKAKVKRIKIKSQQKTFILNSDIITSPLSYDIREKKIKRIDIYLE